MRPAPLPLGPVVMLRTLQRRAQRAGLCAFGALVLGACSRQGAAGNEVGIAVALDPQRAGMQSIYNGVELAVEQLNAQSRGRLGNRHFVMVKGIDTVRDPVKIADRFRDSAMVVGVVGHPESGTTLAAIDEYADTKNGGRNAVVAISPTGTSPTLSKRSKWLFRVCPSDVQSSQAVAQFLLDSMKATRASIIYRNDAYGKDWASSFSDAYRAGNGRLKGTIVQRDPYLQNATPWDAYAGYLRQLKPDVLLFPGSQEDALLALRAMRTAGVTIPLIGGDATSGLEANAAEFPTVRYTAFFLPRTASTPEALAFVDAYTKKFKEEPDQRAALGYDAAMLIGRGAIEVGTDRGSIRDYVESVGRTRPPMAGAAGPIAFDENHDPVNKTVVIARVGK
jgi:branched-chain amino acid transport system substrate-binding protein